MYLIAWAVGFVGCAFIVVGIYVTGVMMSLSVIKGDFLDSMGSYLLVGLIPAFIGQLIIMLGVPYLNHELAENFIHIMNDDVSTMAMGLIFVFGCYVGVVRYRAYN